MFTKLVRIGRDAELRAISNGTSVVSLACVYDIGWGDKKKPQWIEAVIWGKQAESLARFLLKGNQVVIHADDVQLDVYKKNDGTEGSKLKCRVEKVELVDKKNADNNAGQQQAPQQPPQQAPQSQQQQQHQHLQNNGFVSDDFDDTIPF